MPSTINRLLVAELTRRFRAMPNALLVDFTGVSAPQADGLRASLRERDAGMLVVKTRLATLALSELDLTDLAKLMTGPTAFVYGGDPVTLSRALREWSKKERALKWHGGLVEGEILDAAGVAALAALPPLQVLRAQVVGAIASPLSGFVGALQGVLRNVVSVIDAIADKKEAEGQAGQGAP